MTRTRPNSLRARRRLSGWLAVRRLGAALLLVGLLAVAGLGIVGPARAGEGFVPGIDDMPLMSGLIPVGEPMVFDKPTGRIIQSEAGGAGITAAAVRHFYAHTLPALGWHAAGHDRYDREGERLTLVITPGPVKGAVTVQFNIAPR